MQCQAKAKRTGQQCTRHAVTGYEVCVVHGGKTPRGVASAALKHGRYSRSLPTRLVARYEEAQQDERLLELQDEIALIDARLSEVLGRVNTGESGRIWAALLAAKRDYHKAKNGVDKFAALSALLDLIDEGAADEAAWLDVRSLIEQRRRLVESERKRTVELQQNLNVERALLLLGAAAKELRDSVLKHCQDDPQRARRILADASAGIERLVSGGAREVAPAQ